MLQTYILLQVYSNSMIDKKDLLGKHVLYKDRDGKFRVQRVIKVYSSHVTVRHTIKIKTLWKFPKSKVHKSKVLGRQFRKKGLESIKW